MNSNKVACISIEKMENGYKVITEGNEYKRYVFNDAGDMLVFLEEIINESD